MYIRKNPKQAEKKIWMINHLLSTIKTSSTQICRQLEMIKKTKHKRENLGSAM